MASLFVIVVVIVSACAVFASTADWISAVQSMLLELVVPLVVTDTPDEVVVLVLLVLELTLATLLGRP
ncbi:hypothetical protein [Bradyrhizobium sp. cir1]|uniref:hypothetical protein n=1 Tax=unclassified Bradyrhizobium TaxID=2631580 RepID=UPI00179DAF84|nr:hypothetical protein [Bradyrhizobium sp. cir1]MBB4369648.1 hypothetical protein [Bradyrhizobium sp. cir1]